MSPVSSLGARPGTKLEFVGERQPRVDPSFAETVALAIVHDWGPIRTPTLITSFEEAMQLFGDSDTPGRTALALAFGGQNLDGAAGAGGVWVYRMGLSSGGSASAPATHAIQNTTPATALTLTARYHGARGNRISYRVADDPVDASRDIFSVLFDGVVVERYTYANADIAGLVAQINARTNSLVTATLGTNGVALTPTVSTALTGGADGTPVTAAEWLAAQEALETKNFSIFAPYDLTDSTIQAAVLSWVQSMADASKPIMAVVGGGSSDTVTAAIARSSALEDQHVVNLGVGVYRNTLFDPAKDLTTSQLAPMIAGILAARGEERSLTFARLGGLTVAPGSAAAADDEIVAAIEGGVTVLSLSESADAELKVERGVTTFTTPDDPVLPYEIFSDPRLVRCMDIFIRGMKVWGDENIIGATVVNDNTRATVRGEGRRRMDDLEDRGLILPQTAFMVVDPPTDPGLLDAIPFDFGWVFAHTANYLRGKGRIR